jgi:hypothetical protein
LFHLAALAVCLVRSASFAAEPSERASPQRLLLAGLQAEAAGDADARLALLRDAAAIAPDYAPARWQLGHVQVDNQWLPIEAAQRKAAADPRLIEYYSLRDDYGDSAAGQLALARWCQKKGLETEARCHWAGVLSIQPQNEEALRALGVRWFNGQLLTPEQMEATSDSRQAAKAAYRKWKSRTAAWESRLCGDLAARTAVLAEIRALDSVEAIPALDELTLTSDLANDVQVARCRQVAIAWIDALAGIRDYAAAESLARHAIFSPLPSVRNAAVERLKERELHDYVPLLLSGLLAPIESWFKVYTSSDGSVHYTHAFYQEGPFANLSGTRSWSAWQGDLDGRVSYVTPKGMVDTSDKVEPDRSVARKMIAHASKKQAQFALAAREAEIAVARTNVAAAERNVPIANVLVSITGQELGSNPSAWWDWWQEYNGYYEGETPTYASHDYRSEERYYRQPRTYNPYAPSKSCFAKGTLVWTRTGLRPIETIRLGDLVASKNVDTGEIAFKPVVATTIRPPCETVKLCAGRDEVISTLGHPFWVSGAGWRMARELEVGAVLHGLKSPHRLDAIEPAGEAEAHNLVVADFASYIVGEGGILVHDNTPRRPTLATVPGLTNHEVHPDAASARPTMPPSPAKLAGRAP